MMFGSPYQNPVSMFTIPETPRTQASSPTDMRMSTPKKNRSPKKQKSPGSQLMEDVTSSMDGAHLSTPAKTRDLLAVPKKK